MGCGTVERCIIDSSRSLLATPTGGKMPRVTVYHFTKYDITVGEMVLSQRPATLETIISCEGKLLEETAQQVDVSEVDGDGFYTPKGVSGREAVV